MALKISELQIPLVIIGINLLALLNKKSKTPACKYILLTFSCYLDIIII
jgi:hypothetical protein